MSDNPFKVNPDALITRFDIGDIGCGYIVDSFLVDPDLVRALAKLHRGRFGVNNRSAFPGVEYFLNEEFARPVASWWAERAADLFDAGGRDFSLSMRYSMVCDSAEKLSPRQRLCHVDSSRVEDGKPRFNYAGVLYLFHEDRLGGTVFFEPHEEVDVDSLMNDVSFLSFRELSEKYPFFANPSCYHTGTNEFFRKLISIPAAYNRCIFYPSDIFHSGDISSPEFLNASVSKGRLTLNVFVNVEPIKSFEERGS